MSQTRMLKEYPSMSEELRALIERSRATFPSTKQKLLSILEQNEKRETIAYAQESPTEILPEKEVTFIPEPPEPVQWCDKVGWMDFAPFH